MQPSLKDSDMTDMDKLAIDSESVSIQTHLSITQNVIQRMADNSSASKAWCITLVSAMLVIVADKGKPEYTWIALLPTFFFAMLDAYYLALEKSFRNAYNDFINKLHSKTLTANDLYSMSPQGKVSALQWSSMKSFSVWGFYVSLAVLIAITKAVVIG